MYDTPEEYENINQAELARQRNIANNANNIMNMADAASKSSNAYAKAIGGAVKAADKISGGKSTEALGKAMNRANKIAPGGRLAQGLSNRMSESGTSDRINSALNKKNNATPASAKPNHKNSAVAPGKDNSFLSRKEVEEETSDGGGTSFKATVKFLKTAMIAFAPIMIIVIFMNLIVAGSQTYLKIIGLGKADAVSIDGADEKIREYGSEGLLDEEINDENVEEGANWTDTVGYIDFFIDDNEDLSNKTYFIALTRKREYNEADLQQLEDFYSNIGNYKNKNYNMDTVYKFFFKLYYIQRRYNRDYGVDLDMPLIMSILSKQSDDMSDVFSSNIKGYKISAKEDNEYFDYNYDWSSHVLSKDNSSHDIEILARNMVTKREDTNCANPKNGVCYELVSDDTYIEFLKNFLEKKYFLESKYELGGEYPGTSSDFGDSFVDTMLSVANNEYQITNGAKGGQKYIKAYGGFGAGTPWCAIFVSYVTANTSYNGQSLYPDIIKYRSASTGQYIKYFNNSKDENINLYYNDSCKNLKGKNGNITYVPKPGDFIFFDWGAKYYDISSNTQDHIGIVEKYENGVIYTIEGNSGSSPGTVKKKTYNLTDCRVIGFGSWY